MKIAVLYYDGFAEFEVALACLFFKRFELIAIALEDRAYRSEENQRFCVDQTLQQVDVESLDLLIIPGGEPAPLVENPELKRFVEQLLARNKKVAGICGGAAVLAGLGVLDGKRCTGLASGMNTELPSHRYFANANFSDEHVVVDGNITTAQGQAYVEFAVELARQMGVAESEEDYQGALRWFKNMR